MARTTGKDGEVLWGANQVGSIESWSIDESIPIASAAAMGDTYSTKDAGIAEWSGQMTFFADPADTTGQGAITIGASLSGVFREVDDTSGSPEWTGTVIIESINTSVTQNDFTKRTVNFQGSGALTKGTVT
jgi:hypothetical protein